LPTTNVVNGILSIPTAIELCIVGGEPLLFKEEIYEILDGIANTKVRTIIHFNREMEVFHNYGYSRNFLESFRVFRRQFRKYGEGEKVLLGEVPEYYVYFGETVEIGTQQIK